MEYKSSYEHKGKTKIMTVKTGSMFSILFFVLAFFPGFLFFALWNSAEWWLSLVNGLSVVLFLFGGWAFLRNQLEIWVTEDRVIFDQAAPIKKIPRIEFLISEIESVKKDCVTVGSGTRRIDVYPIYLIMKDGTSQKVTSITSDVKMADEIRNFLMKRAGLRGGSFNPRRIDVNTLWPQSDAPTPGS